MKLSNKIKLLMLTGAVLVLFSCSKAAEWHESPTSIVTDTTHADTTGVPINYTPVQEEAYAFPGAEGGGMNASGGRGGKVYKVTSLEDTQAEGTLRHAIEKNEPRIIVFEKSGTIFLKSPLNIKNDNLTIAGQTAPGEGVCIAQYPVNVSADNVIIRYLRFRMGDSDLMGSGASDGSDAIGGRTQVDVIIDHCSVSWSTDETCSFYDNENFTLQWSIISESLRLSGHSKGPHGYGGIWGGVNASFHHNLMAHHDSRTPRFGPGALHAGNDRVDVRNNVFYNWSGNGCYGGEAMNINLVNNYYKPGPATNSKVATRVIQIDVSRGEGVFEGIRGIWGKFYIDGNVFPQSSSVTANNWAGVNFYQKDGLPLGTVENSKLNAPVNTSPVQTMDAITAYGKVLEYAGSSKNRDEIDSRIVNEVKTGTATYKGLNEHNGYADDYPGSEVNWKSMDHPKPGIIDSQGDLKPENAGGDWVAWPVLDSGQALPDADKDGIPDGWEELNRLDPNKYDANGRHLSTAYDNIEVYINSLVENITTGQSQ